MGFTLADVAPYRAEGGGKGEEYQNHQALVPQEPPCALAVETPQGAK